ncbi:MAG TPA: HAD-IB family phosphatase [Gemmatimonadaceae bacterium]|nr:HAD-IB family phosphatase [Gemmatimonadaceae bacterium]
MRAARPRFTTVALDVDSTLCGVEGIDWLANSRGSDVAAKVALETDMAMRGEIPLESVYANRLAAVRPSAEDVKALSEVYLATLAPGASAALSEWRNAGVNVLLLSGGIRGAILPVAAMLGLPEGSVNAVEVQFDLSGHYDDFDHSSALATAMGKRDVLARLQPEHPLLAVGDGSTDIAMREVADAFAAFTGFAARPPVLRHADYVVKSFDELSSIVLGD